MAEKAGQRAEGQSHDWPPGAYGRDERDSGWYCITPNGHPANLSAHEVTEHEDGTITVSPSILVRGGLRLEVEHYHGFLERGVWRDA